MSEKFDQIVARVAELKKSQAHVGILASQGGNEPHVDADGKPGMSLIEIAATHEFGSPAANIPERSFIRSTFAVHAKKELAVMIQTLTRAVLAGKIDGQRAIDLLGLWAASQIKASIAEKKIVQDLAPETIARKGSSTALIDTNQLRAAVTHEVVPLGGNQ